MKNNEMQVEFEMCNKKKQLAVEATKDDINLKKPDSCLKLIVVNSLRVIGLLACLYFFIVSLGLMSSGFRLVAGKKASEFLNNEYVLSNPVTGLMIGVIVTVLVQSSSTSTSIIVSMVGANVMEVRQAIPVIMGANIGTSITSTLVSLGQVSDKESFRRAFAGATVHDCFNLLCVLVFLPLEVSVNYLEKVSDKLVKVIVGVNNGTLSSEPQLLEAITKPMANLIIQLDSKVLNAIALNSSIDKPLIKHDCGKTVNGTKIANKCVFLFESVNLPEWGVGIFVLIISLVCLSGCLIGMVKILSSVFKGPVSEIVNKVVNYEPNDARKYFTGIIAMIVGCVFTILVQSSSVFTSTLVPLVGLGMVSLERVLPMVLGSNIGTTFTGILAALGSTSNFNVSLQIALCHTLFNVSGIVVWYPIPFLRKFPIKMAQFLGDTSAKYRWFAIAYIVFVFFGIPVLVFVLSLTGEIPFYIIMGLVVLVSMSVVMINVLQRKKPAWLPTVLKNWDFLPGFMRSLQLYDNVFMRINCCKSSSKVIDIEIGESSENIIEKPNEEKKFKFIADSKLYRF